ncbi:MAG TPA: hypothetical protein VNE21_08410, partial [Mycobacteriales bacterium]|nr:hypothetical protein [Mycobacteriales bacterium]
MSTTVQHVSVGSFTGNRARPGWRRRRLHAVSLVTSVLVLGLSAVLAPASAAPSTATPYFPPGLELTAAFPYGL